jgi:hypothetical protein
MDIQYMKVQDHIQEVEYGDGVVHILKIHKFLRNNISNYSNELH